MEKEKVPYIQQRVLVLTVGTGSEKQLEKTLIKPILKSIDDGEWDTIILLPSHKTLPHAQKILDRTNTSNVICKPLNISGIESDADKCFGHFDRVLGELIHQGFDRSNITLDFTRGTKAMSAALLMAGMSREISNIRYVSGDERDDRGMVRSGTERIEQVNTRVVDTRQLLNKSENLMQCGNFEAVCLLLQNNSTSESAGYLSTLENELREIKASAIVYLAWDRFDYQDAINQYNDRRNQFINGRFSPTLDMRNWVESLADYDRHQCIRSQTTYVQKLSCDMLANAERRMRDGLYEDAYVRCYRVLELIGQYCLFSNGYDSGKLPLSDQNIIAFEEKLLKKSAELGRIKNGQYATAGRLQVARLLKFLNDTRGEKLIDLGDKHDRYITKNRNNSILFHGFTAANTDQIAKLNDAMKDLENFLLEDSNFPEAKEYLDIARSIKFSLN